MNDQDLYNAFKESSETDRDFDFKNSGWYKVNGLLNRDDQKKRGKWLLFLPWLLTGAMLGFCVFMYQSQSNSNKQIRELITQINSTKTVKIDTITTVKYIYIHDSIVTKRIIYVESGSVNGNELKNNNISASINSNPIAEAKSAKKSIRNLNKTLTNENSTTILPDNNGTEEAVINEKNLMETGKLENIIQPEIMDAATKIIDADSVEVSEFKQEAKKAENKTTSLIYLETGSPIKIAKPTDEKEKENEKPKFNIITEVGGYAGVLLPTQKKMNYQLGYSVGLGYNMFLTPNFQLQLKGAYSQLYFESTQINENIGVPFKASPNPNAGYVFETATSTLSSLNMELGFVYIIPVKYRIRPFAGIAYGGGYLLRNKANYTFYNNIDDDIVVETEDKPLVFVFNNFIPSIGFYKPLNDKWSWYLNGFYNSNVNHKTYATPNYFGVNTSFYYKF